MALPAGTEIVWLAVVKVGAAEIFSVAALEATLPTVLVTTQRY